MYTFAYYLIFQYLRLSVIIPTLNESSFIGKTIERIMHAASDPDFLEIIVIDSGSRDSTCEIVSQYNHIDLRLHPELKGQKYKILNTGADFAKGEILLFLDADTLVPPRFDNLIRDVCSQGCAGGAFEFRLDKHGPAFRFIEMVNRIRYRLGQRYYGDQGIFCTRRSFQEAGGFPPKPIMSASAFCGNLLKTGKLKLIRKEVITSSRRFTAHPLGPLWVLAVDTWIFLLDKLGFQNQRAAEKYWKSNDEDFLNP